MTLAQQLHHSASHAAGIDPACPVCNPEIIAEHAGYQHQFKNGVCTLRGCRVRDTGPATASAEMIDITPESVKTPEGAAKVSKAVDAFSSAQAETANAAGRFLKKYNGLQLREGLSYITEDWVELAELVKIQDAAQEAFLRAVAGR